MVLLPSCNPPACLSCICLHVKQCCYKSVQIKGKPRQKTHPKPRNPHKAHIHWASKRVAASPINQRCPADVVDVSTPAQLLEDPSHVRRHLPPHKRMERGSSCMKIAFWIRLWPFVLLWNPLSLSFSLPPSSEPTHSFQHLLPPLPAILASLC